MAEQPSKVRKVGDAQAERSEDEASDAVEAIVKWYDGKRAFGFVSVEEEAISFAAAGAPEDVRALLAAAAQAAQRKQSAADVFFSGPEAQAAKDSGLALTRGEQVLCTFACDDGLKAGDRKTASSGPRLKACHLRPRVAPLAARGSVASEAVSAARASAQASLSVLAGEVEQNIAPALRQLSSFNVAALQLRAVLDKAWEQHANAGRDALEAFIQGPCFDAVQGFGRHLLLDPDLASDASASHDAAAWLRGLREGLWCWSPQQRRLLEDYLEHLQLESLGVQDLDDELDIAADVADASRVEAVLAQRTSRFVLVLEGVRNSANQQMVLRTCEALGVQEVWLVPPPAGTKYLAAAVRSRHASRGAERLLTLRRLASVDEVAAACAREGRQLWVTNCPSAAVERWSGADSGAAGTSAATQGHPPCSPLTADSDLPVPLPRLALVLGTEGEGISEEMLRAADRAVFLPMHGFMQSLNVAVAGGILLQRLFDLSPDARGDLPAETRADLRRRLLEAVPRLGAPAAGSRERRW